MKKIIAILAACMMLTCTFASCGSSDDSSESSSKKKSSTKTSAASDDEDDEDEEDEDEEEETTKSTKSKKKTTQPKTTEETETEPATDPEPEIETTTKKKSASVRTDGDLVGKWKADDAAAAEAFGFGTEYNVSDVIFEFTDTDLSAFISIDSSSMMCIKDEDYIKSDKEDLSTALENKCFYVSGYNCPILEFDGKSFKTGMGGSYMTFSRDEKDDDVYGEYNIPDAFMKEDEQKEMFKESKLVFEKSGVSSMDFRVSAAYTYDPETGALTSDDFGKKDPNGKTSTIRFEDEDTIVITNKKDKEMTLYRIDD